MMDTPINLNKVDFPLIFGPVNNKVSIDSSNLIVFGTHSTSLF